MKNREAINLYNFLNAIQNKDVSLSINEWKKLSDNRTKLQEILKDIDASRRELVKKYSTDNPEAELVKVDDKNLELFQKEYIEVLEQDNDLELERISMENLGDTMNSEVGIWEFIEHMVTK